MDYGYYTLKGTRQIPDLDRLTRLFLQTEIGTAPAYIVQRTLADVLAIVKVHVDASRLAKRLAPSPAAKSSTCMRPRTVAVVRF